MQPLSCCLLLLWVCCCCCSGSAGDLEDAEWGSGLQELLHSFPADGPFVTETPGRPANCTQRFWLPPSSGVCWDDVAGPEEFERSRLLVLQNRAALQAVSQASGVEDGGAPYSEQALENVRGVREDHGHVAETADTMQKVFLGLEEKRREGTEHYTFSSLKEQLTNARDSMDGREQLAAFLEMQLSSLEKSLDKMQLRLAKLLAR
ncbi:uncharacterized protein LOC114770311 [Denticeps clupeoides]|uniref:uncharacterized protein LOC114770311 n=1 Tax=Denticeps clupeoides TaxID=299321 RepID=UPI0010A4AA1F|nr:uncharacterized protein LOC114770311 [Denticeps clupeoides]